MINVKDSRSYCAKYPPWTYWVYKFKLIQSNLIFLHDFICTSSSWRCSVTHTHSVPQSLIRALPLGIVQKQHVLFGALQAGFSNKRVLDSSYEATVIEVPEYRLGLPSPFSRTPLAGKCQALTSRFYRPWLWPSLCWKVSHSGRSFPVWPSARREGLGYHHRACDWYPHEERDCFYRAFTIRVRSTRCTFGWDSTSAHGEIPLFGACRCNHWFGDCNC